MSVQSAPLGTVLTGRRARHVPEYSIAVAHDYAALSAYWALRREIFVREQGLFTGSDRDDVDDDPRAVVLVARDAEGDVVGGVRLAPAHQADIGWWCGGRLVVHPRARRTHGIGTALVRAACAHAERVGALRFEACVQAANAGFFTALGWHRLGARTVAGHPHVQMRWPVDRFAVQARTTKAVLGGLLAGLHLGGAGFVGDDGAPVPGTDLVAACDAIVPSLVEREPEWAGWCGVLVNVNDLTAMGARPVGLLDALAARDASFAQRVMRGLRDAAQAWDVPVLGGHTQLGTPAALSVTALGRSARPIGAGGGRPGHAVTVSADLAGGWRHGHTGRQWDSTTHRRAHQLRALTPVVADTAPAAAKDVSMAGVVGTLGMLAEASGCGAVLDVADVPTPAGAARADWLGCFPGWAMITADAPDRPVRHPDFVASRRCGELVRGGGVSLRWPDGVLTPAVGRSVTGLGAA